MTTPIARAPASATLPVNAQHHGFTLVELMVALTIGLVILAALGNLFVSSRASYTMGEGQARIQEAGRFAMEFLVQDIRMAGFVGCHNPAGTGNPQGSGAGTNCSSTLCNLVDSPDEAQNFQGEGVRGYTYVGSLPGSARGDWNPTLPDAFFDDGDVVPGTDVILVQYAQSSNIYTAGNPLNNANKKVPYPSAPLLDGNSANGEIVDNDILIISDCKSTDIFRLTNISGGGTERTLVHSSSGNYSSHLSNSYGDGAEIMKLISRVYYVAPAAAGGEPSLNRKELTSAGAVGTSQELVQGIEDMRILYGVDTDAAPGDGTANRYARANAVGVSVGTSWSDVVNVRLGLLIRTPSAKVDQQQDIKTYEVVDGITVDPADDNRRRQVYRSTIQIRN